MIKLKDTLLGLVFYPKPAGECGFIVAIGLADYLKSQGRILFCKGLKSHLATSELTLVSCKIKHVSIAEVIIHAFQHNKAFNTSAIALRRLKKALGKAQDNGVLLALNSRHNGIVERIRQVGYVVSDGCFHLSTP